MLELAGDKTVAIGVIDVANERVETPDDVRATIALARQYLPDERIVCSTNCGMAPMPREVAYAKLREPRRRARCSRASVSERAARRAGPAVGVWRPRPAARSAWPWKA